MCEVRSGYGMKLSNEGWCAMGAESDQVKGKAKQAAGIITGNEKLESEGKSDRRAGEAEEEVEHAKDKIEHNLESAKDKIEKVIDKAEERPHRK